MPADVTAESRSQESDKDRAMDMLLQEALVVMAGKDNGRLLLCTDYNLCQQATGNKQTSPQTLFEDLVQLRKNESSEVFNKDLKQLNQAMQSNSMFQITGVDEKAKTVLLTPKESKTVYRMVEDNDGLANIQLGDGEKSEPGASPARLKEITHDINAEQVRMGHLGNCYFMANLSSVAEEDSNLLKNSLSTNKNHYVVKFAGAQNSPVEISAPTKAEQQVFARGKDADWVRIFEKANRKLTGKSLIDGGGFASDAMQLLTGEKPDHYMLARGHNDAIFNAMDTAKKSHLAMVVGSKGNATNGIVEGHFYSVKKFDLDKGEVVLRNPWAFPLSEKNHNPENFPKLGPGTFKMTVQQFEQQYLEVVIQHKSKNTTYNSAPGSL